MNYIEESSSDNEEDSGGEEIKESFKKKRKAVYQKKFDINDNNQKTERNYAENPHDLLIQLIQYKSNSEILL